MAIKLKLMIVDDESDNLDLLYRTFRRDFQVFKADGPLNALDILEKEGEMAVIISDQSMPEMTGIGLFIKTLDKFPDTIRILLTGYSEDALDGGQATISNANVFKCISKPFDTQELKNIVLDSATIYQDRKNKNNSV